MGKIANRRFRKPKPKIQYRYRAILPNGAQTPIFRNLLKVYEKLKEMKILSDEDIMYTSDEIKQILKDKNILLKDLTWDKY